MQVTEQDKVRLEKRIRTINSMAHIRHAQRGAVPLDYVMGIGGHDLDNLNLGVHPDLPLSVCLSVCSSPD